jgi:hypothetical protein
MAQGSHSPVEMCSEGVQLSSTLTSTTCVGSGVASRVQKSPCFYVVSEPPARHVEHIFGCPVTWDRVGPPFTGICCRYDLPRTWGPERRRRGAVSAAGKTHTCAVARGPTARLARSSWWRKPSSYGVVTRLNEGSLSHRLDGGYSSGRLKAKRITSLANSRQRAQSGLTARPEKP